MAFQRVREGEKPADVIASFGFCRTTIYKWMKSAAGRVRGQTPVVQHPGQRQSISAASAVNARGGFWFQTYKGALSGELFVELLKRMMRHRKKPVHLIIDGLPAHKKALVRDYIKSTRGRPTLHFLPGYAPDLNPDELVWSHIEHVRK